jgi:hypothetical protein
METLINEDSELMTGHFVGDTKRMVILCHKILDRVPGDTYAAWVAICANSTQHHPYVVWNVFATPKGFSAESGIYCSTIKEAIKAYESRGGK